MSTLKVKVESVIRIGGGGMYEILMYEMKTEVRVKSVIGRGWK